MNDVELTKLRQEYNAKYGIPVGFPIHIILLEDEEAPVKAFFTKAGMDEYLSQLSLEVKYKYKLAHAGDVSNVSYTIDYMRNMEGKI